MEQNIQKLAEYIKKAKKIAVLTGAGISTESGIPDFRSQSGVWTKGINREKIISRPYFDANPVHFWEAFKEIFQIKLMGDYKPNYGHVFLTELEQMGKHVTIVTQNVDGLHEDAASSNVIEVHGTIKKAICLKCQAEYEIDHIIANEVPYCSCGSVLKPKVVLFGDFVTEYDRAIAAVCESDFFMVLGSSLKVYPIANLPAYLSNDPKITKAIINREPTDKDAYFQVVIHDSIGDTLKRVKGLL